MRKIPATMATQHPDNACPAYFLDTPYINAKDEIEECYRCFKDLEVEEFMWDWEGKFVDEAVIDRLFNQYHDYFKKNQIGRDIFLTFRIPNIWIESSHKLPRAFMNLLSAEKAAKVYGFHSPPLFEVILPMTTTSDQLIYLQKSFGKIAKATEEIFELKSGLDSVDVIPLFEEFNIIHDCDKIMEGYVKFLKKEFKKVPQYMRVFTARSDTAMNGGFLPAKLSIQIATNNYHNFGKKYGIKVYPWVGGGSLPFRGGINPENINQAINEYKGVASLTIQSAYRYDYDLFAVKKSIKKINESMPKNINDYEKISPEEKRALIKLNRDSAKMYMATVEPMAVLINALAKKLPSHRERVQHIGLFGYSRGLGKVTLPRAIKFTGALYSMGVPPELFASGRTLKMAKERGILDLVMRLCPYLREDFIHAGHYLNNENLELLCKKNSTFKDVYEDVELTQNILGIEIGPKKPNHFIHKNYTSNIYHRLGMKEDFFEDALKAAQIRKSLG